MKLLLSLLFVLMPALTFANETPSPKARLIVMADMGNEPDEVQQMVHMIMYSNEFDVEGLIAVSGKYLHSKHHRPERTRLYPDLFHLIINAYEKDLKNLKKHADDWPEPNYLRSIVKSGQPDYGINGMGHGKSTGGSELIIKCLEKNDPRPLYVVVNAGSNTLTQAITDYEATHSKNELDVILAKLRVFENGAQDNAGAWICSKYPNIYWVRSNYQTYCYGGPKVKGKLEKYGDFFLYTEDADRWIDPKTGVKYNNEFVPVWRWRRAMYNDIKCRMDWCVTDYKNANHNPVAAINGDLSEKIHYEKLTAGKSIIFDASASYDPDGDKIDFNWWMYKEAGNYPGEIKLKNANQASITFSTPKGAKGKEIHLILEIKDKNSIASMYDYRRVVLSII